ncbi:cardiolipin synthase [Cupriavidus basilensis]|uniref:Cardiolipin synthase n=1 Tax=Cupriavidus basilensis TaxID=68895 RepID=A0ABT6AS12_9BURK|nr:cardiolipin synthase [Cupriavidus basilensis]MDF3835418.1 cardiolipin synthase [Cupriavidus basilensis]
MPASLSATLSATLLPAAWVSSLPGALPMNPSWWWPALFTLAEWTIRLAMLVYVPQRRAPAAARTWLLLIFFLPWLGLLLYALFGRIYYPKSRRVKLARINQGIERVRGPLERFAPLQPLPAGVAADTAGLIERLGSYWPMRGNAVALMDDYQAVVARMIADIDAATRQVHLLVYIYADDGTARAVTDALLRASARGVQCRLLVDALGARAGWRAFSGRLREGGVEVVQALPMRSLSAVLKGKSARFDLRNHRKILVVDGRIGYIGSQNVIDAESMPGLPNEELVARVTGPVVAQLQAVFLADRYLETGENGGGGFTPENFPPVEPQGPHTAQMLPSGPGYGTQNAQMALISMIHQARSEVVITTPYFVPDEAFLQALHLACYRGVAVHLVLSQRIDQRFTQAAQEAYFGMLLDSGVRIHLYRPAFLHAKHVTIDDAVAMVGSTNMDIRSFALNAEAALVIYDRAVVARMRQIQQRYLANSALVDRAEWQRRPLHTRTWQNLCRLADSLL